MPTTLHWLTALFIPTALALSGCQQHTPAASAPAPSQVPAQRCEELAAKADQATGQDIGVVKDISADAYRTDASAALTAVLTNPGDTDPQTVPILELFLVGSSKPGPDLIMPLDFPGEGNAIRKASQRQARACVTQFIATAVPDQPRSDILDRIDEAAANHPDTLLIDTNGLSNVSPLDLRRIGPDTDPKAVAKAVTPDSLDLTGTDVTFIHLGVTPEDTLPTRSTLENLWIAICERGKAEQCTIDTTIEPATVTAPTGDLPPDPKTTPWYRHQAVDACALTRDIPGDALFAADSATLLPEAADTLQDYRGRLQTYPRSTARLTGHTAHDGVPQGRLRLSEQRARAIKTWLVTHGVNPRRITTRGVGATQPLVEDRTPDGHLIEAQAAQNRRVEITITC